MSGEVSERRGRGGAKGDSTCLPGDRGSAIRLELELVGGGLTQLAHERGDLREGQHRSSAPRVSKLPQDLREASIAYLGMSKKASKHILQYGRGVREDEGIAGVGPANHLDVLGLREEVVQLCR